MHFTHRLLCLLFVLLFSFQPVRGQLSETDRLNKMFETRNRDTVAWLHGGNLVLGINEGFLHNWAAGGELGSITLNGIFNGYLTYIYHRLVWSNQLDMAYSLYYAYSNDFVPRKLDDRLDFTSKLALRMDTAKDFYLTGLFNFKSQFTNGYDYNQPRWDTAITSRFMSPAFYTLAAGTEYRRGTELSLFLSPVAARLITADAYFTARRPEGAFGIENGKTSRLQLGAYFSGRYTKDITRNIQFRTRLDLYSDYLARNRVDTARMVVIRDHPGNIDILSDNLFSFKISRFINVSVAATLIYDNDFPYSETYSDEQGLTHQKEEPGAGLGWWQIKQLFSFGFQYQF